MTQKTAGNLAGHYGDDFYAGMTDGSIRSARKYLSYLWQYVQPNSAADIGCGRGAWLKACRELGAKRLVGLDGPWNSQEKMIDDAIEFREINLNSSFTISPRSDLLINLEVAEHLEPTRATSFVQDLTSCSDLILFSAAFTHQGGTNHINEQRHSYWGKKFDSLGYGAFDIFRPRFWADSDVELWYRQNTFVYARRESPSFIELCNRKAFEITNIAFMDCIHPDLYLPMLKA